MTRYILAMIMLVFSTSCTSATPYGKCVGVNGNEDPKLKYEFNAVNIALGLFAWELIVPPIVVVLNELKCPVGTK